MKTTLKITTTLILIFFVFQLCYCQQVKTKNLNVKPGTLNGNVDSSTQTDRKMNVSKMNPTGSLNSSEDKDKELSLTDFLLSNKEDLSVVYQAYNRIRLTSSPDSVNIKLKAEIEKVKREIVENKIDYSRVVYTEKDPLNNSRSVLAADTNSTNLKEKLNPVKN